MYVAKQIKTAFENFIRWVGEDVHLYPYDVEFQVYDDDEGVAGTCDFVGRMVWTRRNLSGVWYLDWKTGQYKDRNSHGPQIAKYKEMDGRFPKAGIGVVYFCKDEIKEPLWFNATPYEKRYLKRFELSRRLFYLDHPQLAKKAGQHESL